MVYEIYNRILKSDIEFPQLISIDEVDTWDIEVSLQKIPEEIMAVVKEKGGPAGMQEDFFWVNTPAGYIVGIGDNKIITECMDREKQNIIRTYILGYGLSMLFYKKNIMAVHCSAVEKDGKCLFLSGGSGAGKSTLASTFLERQWKLLADDVAMIEWQEDKLISTPAYPQRKLCRDAVMRKNIPDAQLEYIDEEKDKFAVKCPDEFANNTAEVRALVVIQPYEGECVKIEEVNGDEKARLFIHNLFLGIYFKRLGIPPEKFFLCLQMLSKLKVYRIYRPINAGDTAVTMYETVLREVL